MKVASIRKLVTITLPALVVIVLGLGAGVEAWVRWRWDPLKGSPGFFESDPMRRQRLAPNYTGWFAGVPVHINSLGFRDDREYPVSKGPTTFRILVLGDSVTFGHGSVGEHTYPYLFEQKLKAWRGDVDWQVWNLAVPGYNTSQELAHLLQVGPIYQPDLVIVGFYENDLVDNYAIPSAVQRNTLSSALKSFARRHVYSLELYRRVYLTLLWKIERDDEYHKRLDHLAVEDELLEKTDQVNDLAEQELTPIDRYSDEQVQSFTCKGGQRPNPAMIGAMQREPGHAPWLEAVRRLQALNTSHQYRLIFFLNLTPPVCPDGGQDMFYDGGSEAINDYFVKVFSEGAPTASTYDELRHRRPSQMPNACCHAIGNTNLVKADVLFTFVRDRVQPPRPAR